MAVFASELINKLECLMEKYGDKEIKIVGVFQGGIYSNFTVSDGSNYLSEGFFNEDYTEINNWFLIDEEVGG